MSSKRIPPDGDIIDLAAEKLKRQAKMDGTPDDGDDSGFVFDDELESEGRVSFTLGGESWNMMFDDARGVGADFIVAADKAEKAYWETYRCGVCGKEESLCGCDDLHAVLPGGGIACGADALCVTRMSGFVTCPRCLDVLEKKS